MSRSVPLLRAAILDIISDTGWQTVREIDSKIENYALSSVRNELILLANEGVLDKEVDTLRSGMVARCRYRLRVREAA